ncbi:hypothetical protein [Bdellovibrio bacteriovorus]|uniref:Uncharacterized protein n=1 Tax=Bdellovibrio bacteriovorus TaxID=959 RepID=A0A1Z3NDM3_BDEBC|nr:hypothetical protein [Bdellovibrio bacteriovorus]ASD65561.1 hypothetical protein B9G79_15925 [Bdellovibrio bacteriovorus]
MFKAQPSDTQFIIVTFVLVLLLGIPTFMNLTEDSYVVAEEEVFESAQAPALAGGREPASIPSAKVAAVSRLTQFDLSCAKKALSPLSVDSGYVQFEGKNCLRGFKEGDVEIINKSNGYTASIFLRGTDKYQTDLIQLKKGDNEITIRYRERSGKAVEEVLLVRSSQI